MRRTSLSAKSGMKRMRLEHAEMDMGDHTDTWLKRGVSNARKRDRGESYLTPGNESLKNATKVTGSQWSLNSKWMAP